MLGAHLLGVWLRLEVLHARHPRPESAANCDSLKIVVSIVIDDKRDSMAGGEGG